MDLRCAYILTFLPYFTVCGTKSESQFNILNLDFEKAKLRHLSELNNTNIPRTEDKDSFLLIISGGENSIGSKNPASNDKSFHRKTLDQNFKPKKVKNSGVDSEMKNISEAVPDILYSSSEESFLLDDPTKGVKKITREKFFSKTKKFGFEDEKTNDVNRTFNSIELLEKLAPNSKLRSHFKVIHTSVNTKNEDLTNPFPGVTLKPFHESEHKLRSEEAPFELVPLNRANFSVPFLQTLYYGASEENPHLVFSQRMSTNKFDGKIQQAKESMNTIKELKFSDSFSPKEQQHDFKTGSIFQAPSLSNKFVQGFKHLNSNANGDAAKEIIIADLSGINLQNKNKKREANRFDHPQVEGKDTLQSASSNDAEKTTKVRESRKTDSDTHAISVNTLKTFQLLKQEEKDRRNPDFDVVETFHPQIIPNIYEIGKDDPKVSLRPQNPNIFTNTNFGTAIIPVPIIPNVVNIPSSFSNTLNTNLEPNGLNFNNFNLQQPINRNFIPLSNSLFLINVPQHQQHQVVVPQHFLQNIPSSVGTTAVSNPVLITSFNPGHNLQTLNFLNNNNNDNKNKNSKQDPNFISVQNAIPQFPIIPTIHSPNINVRPLIHDNRVFPHNADGSFITFRSPNDAFNFRI